jgi:hypothetical protein
MRNPILTAALVATLAGAFPATAQTPRSRPSRDDGDVVIYVHPVRRYDPGDDDPRGDLRAPRALVDDYGYYDPRDEDPRSDLRARRRGRTYTADDLRRDQRTDLRDRRYAPREEAEEDDPPADRGAD